MMLNKSLSYTDSSKVFLEDVRGVLLGFGREIKRSVKALSALTRAK